MKFNISVRELFIDTGNLCGDVNEIALPNILLLYRRVVHEKLTR